MLAKENVFNRVDTNNLKYGSILECTGITSNLEEVDTVMIINDITSDDEFNCKILDLSNFEIIADFKDIKDFQNNKNIKIIKILKY